MSYVNINVDDYLKFEVPSALSLSTAASKFIDQFSMTEKEITHRIC